MKSCQTWACCEVVWSSLTQSSHADFPHALLSRVWGSISWLGLDKRSLSWDPEPIPLKGKSVATPVICTAYWFWGWREISGLHIKNSLQCNEPGIISPLKSESPGKIVSLLSFQDNVGRRAGHCGLCRLWQQHCHSTNHDLEDSNCSQIIPLLLLSAAFFMSLHGFCLTSMRSFYSDNPPVTPFLYTSPVVLFFWLEVPFICQQGVLLSEYIL